MASHSASSLPLPGLQAPSHLPASNRRRQVSRAFLAALSLLLAWLPRPLQAETDYKVYVMLGFHVSLYHSWRGDSNDEAGFGQDIRLTRDILKTLAAAEAQGLTARGYWDMDGYYTLETLLPRYAPDIIASIQARVNAGKDEVVPMPYNNGANHAATEDELRTALRYAMENPFGSGFKQVFSKVTPLYRPQESMYTSGMNRILLEEGYQGIILYYSTVPFDAFGALTPALPWEARFNPLRLKGKDDDPPITLLPCISPGDLVNYVSMEKLMRDLHRAQERGEIRRDVVIHLNFDADADTWAPADLPKGLRWFPNAGGLMEYVRAVNRYPWAAFTTPGEYLATHPPVSEITLRQDLADGGFGGSYSWAEKAPSLRNWTRLEGSRLHSWRAQALLSSLTDPKRAARKSSLEAELWSGPASAFFRRLIGLTTTHFGMSTPVLNEERQAKADTLLEATRQQARQVEREAAAMVRQELLPSLLPPPPPTPDANLLYRFLLYNYPRGRNVPPRDARAPVRVPLILPADISIVQLYGPRAQRVPASLVDIIPLPDGSRQASLLFATDLEPLERREYQVWGLSRPAERPVESARRLNGQGFTLSLDEQTGVSGFMAGTWNLGGADFLSPFITYQPGKRAQVLRPGSFKLLPLPGERVEGAQRSRLQAEIPIVLNGKSFVSTFTYTFTVLQNQPGLLLDVVMDYAYTPPTQIIHTMQQKLRRLLDLRWLEVAPIQLHPLLDGSLQRPLKVWKRNHLGVSSGYALDYGQVNPKNRELDAFNHQATAGQVAVSDGRRGLLLATSGERLSSLAFCPMRLRDRQGAQELYLNPFGSYHGRQLDYTHLVRNDLGARFSTLASGSLKPNGPSFNGEHLEASLLLVPYAGDGPDAFLQDTAQTFFAPPGVIYLRTPPGLELLVPEDVALWSQSRQAEARALDSQPLPPPTAFLANPVASGVSLVWDAPRDPRVTGYLLRWKAADQPTWQDLIVPPGRRFEVSSLQDGVRYSFQLQAVGPQLSSPFTPIQDCVPGQVPPVKLTSAVDGATPGMMLKAFWLGLVHLAGTR